MISYAEFLENCEKINSRIRNACDKSKRAFEDIRLLPVTKMHPFDVAEYSYKAGFKSVGENRVQEAIEKMPHVNNNLQWELIGHLQSNKANLAAKYFARVQSVDSEKLLLKLDNAALENEKVLRILLQINAGRDPAKFGADIEEAPALMEYALNCKNLKVEGLMTIAALDSNLDTASKCFENLRNIRDSLEASFSVKLSELSMGMSGDLERAIEEGSTMIRVGTALFGERDYGQSLPA